MPKPNQAFTERLLMEQRLKRRGPEARICLEAEVETKTRKVLRFRMVYINPLSFAGDNGRVLGYDNAHGYWHRHYLGSETQLPEMNYETLVQTFEKELAQVLDDESNGKL